MRRSPAVWTGLTLLAVLLPAAPAVAQADDATLNTIDQGLDSVEDVINTAEDVSNGNLNLGGSNGLPETESGNIQDVISDVVGDNLGGGLGGGNSGVQDAIGGVIDDNTLGSISEGIGIINRIQGIGEAIAGLISSFNLERILDIANLSLDLDSVVEEVYIPIEDWTIGKGKDIDGPKDPTIGGPGEGGGSEGGSGGDLGGGTGGGVGGGTGGNAIGSAPTGALGIPILEEADTILAESGTTPLMELLGGKQEGGSVPGVRSLENVLRTQITESVAYGTALSEEGQQKLVENTEIANTALETSTALAEDSESQDVSQNILRNVSTQLQTQQQDLTLLAVDSQLRARDDALRNITLSRSLIEIQGQRIRNHRLDASAYSAVITQGGSLLLPGLEAVE